MKIALFCTVALVAVVGLALAQGGYGYGGDDFGMGFGPSYVPFIAGPKASRGSGLGGLLPLLMLLFLLPLFSGSRSSNNDRIILVNSTLTV